ncbi:hypothetical protein PR002_g14104 [Phytophthora rubi]|uniref:Uncharacterized protein n=1 Tax=Phytophthora rubi TaxID=129364 RepID=A0A6A3L9J0_9STRA|nr:hypothetical protein PR002_g14104 [Phytophthora rubi]
MIVEALIIEGNSAEFLVGEEWMLKKGVRIDFVSVSAPDGTEGLFLPDRRVEPHLFMAPTLAVVQRGKGITKLAHQWVGPAKVVQDAGFDNVEVVRDDTGGHLVTHSSFLVASSCPSDSLGAIAERILAELAKEDDEAENVSPENERPESLGQNPEPSEEPKTQQHSNGSVKSISDKMVKPVTSQHASLGLLNNPRLQQPTPRRNR